MQRGIGRRCSPPWSEPSPPLDRRVPGLPRSLVSPLLIKRSCAAPAAPPTLRRPARRPPCPIPGSSLPATWLTPPTVAPSAAVPATLASFAPAPKPKRARFRSVGHRIEKVNQPEPIAGGFGRIADVPGQARRRGRALRRRLGGLLACHRGAQKIARAPVGRAFECPRRPRSRANWNSRCRTAQRRRALALRIKLVERIARQLAALLAEGSNWSNRIPSHGSLPSTPPSRLPLHIWRRTAPPGRDWHFR